MRYYFAVLFLLFIPLASGVNFSPSKLIYLLGPNEELCQMIEFESEAGVITVSDKWAESIEVDWDVNLFEKNTSEHGLVLSYTQKLHGEDGELEICLLGSKEGEYHGAVLFEQERRRTVTQWAVWLKVVVETEKIEVSPPSSGGGGSGGGGSGGGGSGGKIDLSVQVVDMPKEILVGEAEEIEEVSDYLETISEDLSEIEITGNAFGDQNVKSSGLLLRGIIPAGFIVALVLTWFLVYVKRRKGLVN